MSGISHTLACMLLLAPAACAGQAEVMLTYDRVDLGELGPLHDFRSIAVTANCWVSGDTLFLADSVDSPPSSRVWLWTDLGDRPMILTDSIRANRFDAAPVEVSRFCPGGDAPLVGTYNSTGAGVPFRGTLEVSGYTLPDR